MDLFLSPPWAGEQNSLLVLSQRCDRNAGAGRGEQGRLRETEGRGEFASACSEWGHVLPTGRGGGGEGRG